MATCGTFTYTVGTYLLQQTRDLTLSSHLSANSSLPSLLLRPQAFRGCWSTSFSMRRKPTTPAMASDQPDNATHSVQESPKEQQNNELARSAKRLYGFANSAAQALAAIPYLHTSTSDAQVMRDLVQKIYALAAITSSFLESLMVESMTGGDYHKDMWSKDHHLRLLNSTERCKDVFAAIGHAVRIADEHFQVTGVGKGENYLDGFKLDSQQQAQITIDECYGLVSQTNVISKHTALARIENL